MAALGWWTLADRSWSTLLASDEFGNGTLTGNPADGPSFDGCSAAAQENAAAAFEERTPLYVNIGHIRADMIAHGDWDMAGTPEQTLHNPRTTGATLQAIIAEIPRRNYVVGATHLPSGPVGAETVLTSQQLHDALVAGAHAAIIFFVRLAYMMSKNEQNVLRHFVVGAGYGGDQGTIPSPPAGYFDEHGWGKVLILNSDVAGQHGVASGQWMTLDTLAGADVIGYTVMAKPVAPIPPQPPTGQLIVTVDAATYHADKVTVTHE